MVIVLLNDGLGIPHCETAYLTSRQLNIEVVGAPENAILTVSGKHKAVRTSLDASGKCRVFIGDMFNDEVTFTISAGSRIWHTDGIRVTKDEDGNIYVHSLVDYGKLLKQCYEEIDFVKTQISKMKEDISTLRGEVERYKKDYQIV